jgi:hypothetical protein
MKKNAPKNLTEELYKMRKLMSYDSKRDIDNMTSHSRLIEEKMIEKYLLSEQNKKIEGLTNDPDIDSDLKTIIDKAVKNELERFVGEKTGIYYVPEKSGIDVNFQTIRAYLPLIVPYKEKQSGQTYWEMVYLVPRGGFSIGTDTSRIPTIRYADELKILMQDSMKKRDMISKDSRLSIANEAADDSLGWKEINVRNIDKLTSIWKGKNFPLNINQLNIDNDITKRMMSILEKDKTAKVHTQAAINGFGGSV